MEQVPEVTGWLGLTPARLSPKDLHGPADPPPTRTYGL